jgi:uncharacterized protein YneF (UPF0154 family)
MELWLFILSVITALVLFVFSVVGVMICIRVIKFILDEMDGNINE